MKLCKFCQQPNRTKGVYCSVNCKTQYQTQDKAARQKVTDRENLIARSRIHSELAIDGLPAPQNNTYGEVIDSLALRVYATTKYDFNGYWHPGASDAIIATLGIIKEGIGDKPLDSYGYYTLKMFVEGSRKDHDIIQYLWIVLVADFLFQHFHGRDFSNRATPRQWAKLSGCIKDTKGVGRPELYSSGDKAQLTARIGGKVKGVVPDGCSLEGRVFGMQREATKKHTFAIGETFYADVQRCPFSSGFYDSNEFVAVDNDYNGPMLLDTDIGSTLVWVEVTEELDSHGPRKSFGSVPLHWLTHSLKVDRSEEAAEWKVAPDWKTLAQETIDSIK